MKLIKDLVVSANDRILFIVGGLLWTFAGARIFTLGYGDLFNNSQNPFSYILGTIIVYILFYNFIFSKMVKKHLKRIIESAKEKYCIFSFFDIKGYVIMAIMIAGGITIRSSGIINPVYLGSFYLGLGGALATSGVMYFLSGINYERTLATFK